MGADDPDDPEQLYQRLRPALYRYAVMILADAREADDAIQQVFVRLLQRHQALIEPGRYLRRATRNACYDLLRHRHRYRAIDDSASILEATEAGDDRPLERLAIEQILRRLPPEQREVVHLKVFEGLTFDEIAEQITESTSTVASRYRYAMKKLKQAFNSGG